MAVNTESIPPSHTNGVMEDGYDDDEKMKVRPADIDADMREMERRKRVELIMNSRLFREELERIIESQIKAGNSSAGLLQQISDMVGSKYSGVNNHLFRGASCAVPINDIRGVEAMGYAKGEKILRCKLAALFRLIDLYGWSQGIYNHVTARLSQKEEHFLVNPYGLLYSEVTASSLVKVDMQGNVIESGTTNFSVNVTGFQLHAAIYAARPDLKCIVHLHTPSVLAVSSLKDGLLPICQEAAVIGDISHHSYIGIPNEPEERDKIVRNLGPNNKVIFLTNQGALCCGETIEETFFYAYNTVNACETQLKVLPLGKDNLVLLSDETKKSMYDAARKVPENISPPVSNVPSAAAATEKRWRIGGLEFEALMRMLDNAGFRTGYVYRQPLIKGELPRPRNDVEVPPAVSSLGYLLEEEELYKGQWKKGFGAKGSDRIRWLNSPNVYQKVEILETGTSDPKKITKWVDANNEEWVADGSPSHTSTPVKIENALQFVPKNTNPKEFKKLQQQIKENRRADKITSGPQSHILEGVSWEEAKKLQDANMSGTSDQVILVGAASKGIIQREFQHNATVYKTPYAKNPFDAITDEEIENYKKDITRKQRGDSYYDEDESDALSSSLPPSEMRVIQIETTTVPKASQAEVVLSDEKYDYADGIMKYIVRIWEIKKMRPIIRTIAESDYRHRSFGENVDLVRRSNDGINEVFKQIAQELTMRFKHGNVFKRSERPAFLPVANVAPEFHDVRFTSRSFDCSDTTEITTWIELPTRKSWQSLESVHDFSSDPTTEDEDESVSPERDKKASLLSLSSCIGQEYENPEEINEMDSSAVTVSDDTSHDEVTVISRRDDGVETVDKHEADDSLSSSLVDDDVDVAWNTYESLNDVDDDYHVQEVGGMGDECVTSFAVKNTRYKPELDVIYEESIRNSDTKCLLKSILDDSKPSNDTTDTYAIEGCSEQVREAVERFVALKEALLERLKGVKLDAADTETISSARANCFANDNDYDSDAHTISDTSLVSCLADSTEDVGPSKNDDGNDESDRVLDSGCLMEDAITCSSEGDFTDIKGSEIVSNEIADLLPSAVASSDSDEAQGVVWITQIEKIFDYDIDDLCLKELFSRFDDPTETLYTENDIIVDAAAIPNDELSNRNNLSDDNVSSRGSSDVLDDILHRSADSVDNRYTELGDFVETTTTTIPLTEAFSGSELEMDLSNAAVIDVPEITSSTSKPSFRQEFVTSSPCRNETERDLSQNCDVSLINCSCNRNDDHVNCEICKFIKEPEMEKAVKLLRSENFDFENISDTIFIEIIAAVNELPYGVDTTYLRLKNMREIFGDSIVDDIKTEMGSFKEFSNDVVAVDAGKVANEDDSCVCNDVNMMNAAGISISSVEEAKLDDSVSFEENNSFVNEVIPDLSMLLQWNGALDGVTTDSIVVRNFRDIWESATNTEKFSSSNGEEASDIDDFGSDPVNGEQHEDVQDLSTRDRNDVINVSDDDIVAEDIYENNNYIVIDDIDDSVSDAVANEANNDDVVDEIIDMSPIESRKEEIFSEVVDKEELQNDHRVDTDDINNFPSNESEIFDEVVDDECLENDRRVDTDDVDDCPSNNPEVFNDVVDDKYLENNHVDTNDINDFPTNNQENQTSDDKFNEPMIEPLEENVFDEIEHQSIDTVKCIDTVMEIVNENKHENGSLKTFDTTEYSLETNKPSRNNTKSQFVDVSNNDELLTAPEITYTTISSGKNSTICDLLDFLDKRNFFAGVDANDESKENISPVEGEKSYITVSETSGESHENTVVSDCSNIQENYATVSDASIDPESSDSNARPVNTNDAEKLDHSFIPETETNRAKCSPNRKSRISAKSNDIRVRVRNGKCSNEQTPTKEPTTRKQAANEKSRNSQDYKEYSVKLKLSIEWDNKLDSSESTSKSSSFEDSLNNSDSAKRYDNNNNQYATRVLEEFKNEYPKFILYEYFSPKVKIQRTPKKRVNRSIRLSRNIIEHARKLTPNSPNGGYRRYCDITEDLCKNESKGSPLKVNPKLVGPKNRSRKVLRSINTNATTPMKTSTPVLASEYVNVNESIIECLSSTAISPILNSLEEFELFESILSCEN